MKLSAVIVIRNESKNLRAYFEHLMPFVDDFVVADQCSTDNSVEICKEYGARVIRTHNWGYSEPDKEFILNKAKNDWVITLDPDERFSWKILANLNQIMNMAEEGNHDGISFKVHFSLDGYTIPSLSGMLNERIIKKGVKCGTRIHMNYAPTNLLSLDFEQFHYKYSEDTLNKENKRLKLQDERIQNCTITKNNKMMSEFDHLKSLDAEKIKNTITEVRKK